MSLIITLDFPSLQEALRLVDQLGEEVNDYKVGLDVWSRFFREALIGELTQRGKKILLDLKLYDTPRVVGAVAQATASWCTPRYVTVHAEPTLIKAVARELPPDTGVLAVPYGEWEVPRALAALAAGARGLVAAPREMDRLRRKICGEYVRTMAWDGSSEQLLDEEAVCALSAQDTHWVVGGTSRWNRDPLQVVRALRAQRPSSLFTT